MYQSCLAGESPPKRKSQNPCTWLVQVSDFNLSKLVSLEGNPAVLSSAQATNPRGLAPEVLEGDPATLHSVGTHLCIYQHSLV